MRLIKLKASIKSKYQELLKVHAKDSNEGIRFYASVEEIQTDLKLSAYTHLLVKAWRDLQLSGVVCVEGVPTVYLRLFEEPLEAEQASEFHNKFWNQGVAKILVLADPENVNLYSGLAIPGKPGSGAGDEKKLIETLRLTEYTLRVHEFYIQLATGQYYQDRSDKFDPKQSVDSYLLTNLASFRDAITSGTDCLQVSEAHTFLARILFICYLVDRGIIDLSCYRYCDCAPGSKLVDLLEPLQTKDAKKTLYQIFNDLKSKFNGSMFDRITEAEKNSLGERHVELLIHFLRGHKLKTRQLSLGFWAYDFQWIPVETISAIYEDFLANEDQVGKQLDGAFYTPRFLAETLLDVAIQEDEAWATKRYLDPACGSGIFLVAIFNRLATQWLFHHPDILYDEKASSLLRILENQICGVDISQTACRIACFSLYLAFLDRFDPPDIVGYVERVGRKLPKILHSDVEGVADPDFPVIYREDFLSIDVPGFGKFDYVIGNPPWVGRSSKQIAQRFALSIPEYLENKGRACILLPSKVLFNSTSNKFQYEWLKSVTIEKIIQLADYRYILFKNAICPSVIARYTTATQSRSNRDIEYETPKVRRIDLRNGIIPIAPRDRKRISHNELLYAAKMGSAPVVWKQHLWGSTRDIKFLKFLMEMPPLKDCVDVLDELRKSKLEPSKKWITGQGFKPYKNNKPSPKDRKLVPINWSGDELLITPKKLKKNPFPTRESCTSLSEHLSEGNYRYDKLYSKPPEAVFSAPLILINQGFTECSFFDYPVRFRHSLHAIAGRPEDEDLLLFLTFYLRSNLAQYFLFHTAASWGTERKQVNVNELLRLPFPLPDSDYVSNDGEKIVRLVAEKARSLKLKLENLSKKESDAGEFKLTGGGNAVIREKQQLINELKDDLEPLFCHYFDFIEQEIILIEDTVEIFIESSTPQTINSRVPTLETIHNNSLPTYKVGLKAYADVLVETLNTWAKQAGSDTCVSAIGSVDSVNGLAVVHLEQSTEQCTYKEDQLSNNLNELLSLLNTAAEKPKGSLDYLRGVLLFEGTGMRLLKPCTVEYWTKTAALNDAAEIYARVTQARRSGQGEQM